MHSGTEEYTFENLDDKNIAELEQLKDNPSVEEFNKLILKLSNRKVRWSNIFKGKYSGVVRKNTTNTSNETMLERVFGYFFGE